MLSQRRDKETAPSARKPILYRTSLVWEDIGDFVLPMMTVRAVSHFRDEEMGFEAVVLADQDLAPAWQLEFQRSLDPDEQDVALGMGSYCVTLTNGACAYGCLSSALVEEGRLHVVFMEDGAQKLGLESPELELSLDLDADQVHELVRGLQSVLGGDSNPPVLN
ncbi:Imm10 family immunity protein [Arthrobacter sp. alpha11c]